MSLSSVRIVSGAVAVKPTIASKSKIFSLLADMAANCYGLEKRAISECLAQRETLGSTGFGGAVAIPHAKIDGLKECVGLFVRLETPMAFDAHDAQPVDLVFCLLSPVQGGAEHLKALAEISRFLRDDDAVGKLRGANSADALYVLLTGLREQQAA